MRLALESSYIALSGFTSSISFFNVSVHATWLPQCNTTSQFCDFHVFLIYLERLCISIKSLSSSKQSLLDNFWNAVFIIYHTFCDKQSSCTQFFSSLHLRIISKTFQTRIVGSLFKKHDRNLITNMTIASYYIGNNNS